MTYEKRIVGVNHGFTRAYLEKRARECAEEELKLEKQKLLLYFELLEI